MTRDEVLALSDEELRSKAAELAGWILVPCQAFRLEVPSNPEIAFTSPGAMWEHAKSGQRQVDPPDYLHDIAAAVDLAEHASEHGWLLVLTKYYTHWGAQVLRYGNPAKGGSIEATEQVDAGGEVPSLAITRAIVLAMAQK